MTMKFLSAAFTLVAIATPLAKAATPLAKAATNCSTSSTMMTNIEDFVLSDAIAFCPTKMCIRVTGQMNGMLIAGPKGKFSISAKVNGKEVYTSVQDACPITRCPTTSGFMILPVPMTASFPAHVADFTFKLTSGDGKTVFCQALTYGTPVPTTTTTTTTTVAPTPTYTPPDLPPKYPESKNCVNITTVQDVSALTITSDDFCIDQPYLLTVTGPLSAPIVEGTMLKIIGKYLGRTFYRDEADLCELLAAAGTPCPVPTTVTSWSIQRIVKKGPSRIPLAFTMTALNPNGSTLFCRQ
ncbi:hypothetical protein BGZ93_002781, partial [Podila epicladia]